MEMRVILYNNMGARYIHISYTGVVVPTNIIPQTVVNVYYTVCYQLLSLNVVVPAGSLSSYFLHIEIIGTVVLTCT